MDITQIITESLPEGIVLPVEALSDIVKKIKKQMGETSIPKEWYSKKTAEWDKKRLELEEALAAANARSGEEGTLLQALEEERAAHAETKARHAAENDTRETAALVRSALLYDGANPVLADLLEKEIDKSAVIKDGGIIKNWSEVSQGVKERYAAFFGEVVREGADVGSPPAPANEAPDPFLAGLSE